MSKYIFTLTITLIALLSACSKSGGGGDGGSIRFTDSRYAGSSYFRHDFIQSGVGIVFADSTYADSVQVREASNNYIYFIRKPGDTLGAVKSDSNVYYFQNDYRTLINFRFTAPDSLKFFYSNNAGAPTLDYRTIRFKGKKL
jgi:hypothetical protein